jgi:hypothetical protein
VIRYEDLVKDPTTILFRLHDLTAPITHQIRVEPPELRYPAVDLAPLARALLPVISVLTPFYPDIERDLARRL